MVAAEFVVTTFTTGTFGAMEAGGVAGASTWPWRDIMYSSAGGCKTCDRTLKGLTLRAYRDAVPLDLDARGGPPTVSRNRSGGGRDLDGGGALARHNVFLCGRAARDGRRVRL